MNRISSTHCALAVFAGIIFIGNILGNHAAAMDIQPGAGVALQYTDNARKAASNEVSDLLVITHVGANIDAASGPFQLAADTSLKHINYTHDTFSNQQYFNLKASAGWEMLKDTLDWQLQNYFSQQSIDSLNPNTPDNIQNSNVFTFGPNIYYRPSGRQTLTLSPQYRKFSYEIQNIDNQQSALDARWDYQLSRTVNVGVRSGLNQVDYDDPLNTDHTFRNLHLTLSATRADYNYSADIGVTRVERENMEHMRGITGKLRWLFDITGRSTLHAYLASDLTDTNSSLLNSSINPDDGDFSNEQISAEVLRNNIFRLTYKKNDASVISTLWLELRKQDYEFALFDQQVQAIGLDFDFPLTATFSTGINADYSDTELTDVNREDYQYGIGGNIKYRFSRKLLGTVNVKYYDTDSSLAVFSFSELTVFAGLTYGYSP